MAKTVVYAAKYLYSFASLALLLFILVIAADPGTPLAQEETAVLGQEPAGSGAVSPTTNAEPTPQQGVAPEKLLELLLALRREVSEVQKELADIKANPLTINGDSESGALIAKLNDIDKTLADIAGSVQSFEEQQFAFERRLLDLEIEKEKPPDGDETSALRERIEQVEQQTERDNIETKNSLTALDRRLALIEQRDDSGGDPPPEPNVGPWRVIERNGEAALLRPADAEKYEQLPDVGNCQEIGSWIDRTGPGLAKFEFFLRFGSAKRIAICKRHVDGSWRKYTTPSTIDTAHVIVPMNG